MDKIMNITEAAVQPYVEKMNALVAYRKEQLAIAGTKEEEWDSIRKEFESRFFELSKEQRKDMHRRKDAAYAAYEKANSRAYHSGNAIMIWAKNILTLVGNNIVPYYLGRVGPKTCEKIKTALSSYLEPIFDCYDVSKTPCKEVCVSARIHDLHAYVMCDADKSVEKPFGDVFIPKLSTPEDVDELLWQKEQLEKEFDLLHAEVAEKIRAIYNKLPYVKSCLMSNIRNIELL